MRENSSEEEVPLKDRKARLKKNSSDEEDHLKGRHARMRENSSEEEVRSRKLKKK